MNAELRSQAWAHITELGERHRVKVRHAKTWAKSEAHAGTRQVWVPPRMHRPAMYLIALHEFGHVCQPSSRRILLTPYYEEDFFTATYASEGYAWGWAIDNARPDLLAAMSAHEWCVIGECLSSFAIVRAKERCSSAGYA